jgi:putative toxin-antitoxin system antitoxin component (TIGR02293 family)
MADDPPAPYGDRSRSDPDTDFWVLATRYLGGRKVLKGSMQHNQDVHARIEKGLPGDSLLALLDNLQVLNPRAVLSAMHISERSFARRKASPEESLPIEESNQLWQFTELLAQATQTLGSQEAAEQWFASPARGLAGQRPIDLIRTAPGTRLVSELLVRMEYGVYV